MKIIGIAGKAGTGKDTAADYLVANYGFVKYNLADPIKKMLDVIGVDCRRRETKELPHPVFGISPRRMAQTLGTEWMRANVHPQGWLLLAEEFVKTTSACSAFDDIPLIRGVVIPDVRFENEAEWLRALGGQLWHIERNVSAVENHVSEAGVAFKDGDKKLPNMQGPSFLFHRISYLMQGIPNEMA